MDNNRLNELLIKEVNKALTPLQAAELALLRQLQDNIAAQAVEASTAQAIAVEAEEAQQEAEVITEEIPVVTKEKEVITSPTAPVATVVSVEGADAE